MPNHCTNTLTVTGPAERVAAFARRATADLEEGFLRTYLPFPPELEGDEITGADGEVIGQAFTNEGYEWCLSHWGTKWGDYDLELTGQADGEATLRFLSAWSPPIEGVRRVSALEEGLTFILEYREDANMVLGAARIADGEVVQVAEMDPAHYPDFPDGEALPDEDDGSLEFEEVIQDVAESLAEAVRPA